jgi:hypothetical protein
VLQKDTESCNVVMCAAVTDSGETKGNGRCYIMVLTFVMR